MHLLTCRHGSGKIIVCTSVRGDSSASALGVDWAGTLSTRGLLLLWTLILRLLLHLWDLASGEELESKFDVPSTSIKGVQRLLLSEAHVHQLLCSIGVLLLRVLLTHQSDSLNSKLIVMVYYNYNLNTAIRLAFFSKKTLTALKFNNFRLH